MSFPRTTGVLARAGASTVTKFAAQSSAPRTCPQCLRAFSSFVPYRASSKRQLQTASAYQPTTLHPEPPPRSWGVPNTSIAGTKSEVINPLSSHTVQDQQSSSAAQKHANASTGDGEAQQSKPAPAGKPLRPRKYNFGPRKAIIKLSPSAVAHLRSLLDQPHPKLIRIGTRAKGCSGLQYHLEYVDKPSLLDEQVEQDGVKVLIDNKALLNLIGSEMHWEQDKLNERFVFKNPNITEQCGCGESFSVK